MKKDYITAKESEKFEIVGDYLIYEKFDEKGDSKIFKKDNIRNSRKVENFSITNSSEDDIIYLVQIKSTFEDIKYIFKDKQNCIDCYNQVKDFILKKGD